MWIFELHRSASDDKSAAAISDKDRMLQEKEEELRRMQEMLEAMRAKVQLQNWISRIISIIFNSYHMNDIETDL